MGRRAAATANAAEVGLRVPIQTRTTQELRDRLAAEAQKAGRSIAQEVELRLEKSFDFVDIINKSIEEAARASREITGDLLAKQENIMLSQCGGDELFLLWQMPAYVIQQVERQRSKKIREDEETRRAAERACLGAIVDVFRDLPMTYSDWKEEAKAKYGNNRKEPKSGLAALGEYDEEPASTEKP